MTDQFIKMEEFSKSRSADKHKQVECKVCLRKMRSDNLKRHMLKHRELQELDEDEIRSEIKRRKELRETRQEREKLVKEIADEEGFSLEYRNIETPDALTMEKELLDDDQIYATKGRGRITYTILRKGSVREDSLSKKNKESLELYRKQMSTHELSNTELRTWQQQLMDTISSPSDREIIWVVGVKGNEGKTWFQES